MDYMRQLRMFDPSEHENVHITIAGAGNIGSHAALALTRMGIKNFTVFDFDKVEAHNLSSQAYYPWNNGDFKVNALTHAMHSLNEGAKIEGRNEPFTGVEQVGEILISAVDSMEARRAIAKNLPPETFVIDGRMGGGQIEVWSQMAKDWPATLTRDGDDDPCSARYISYTSYLIAGLIANQVKRHILKENLASRILMHADTLQMIVEYAK